MKYQNYLASDFMMDDFFVRWVKNPDPDTDLFWKNWLAMHPEKAAETKLARQMLEDLNFKVGHSSQEDYQEVWDRLQKSYHRYKEPVRKHALPRPSRKFQYWAAAAVISLVVVSLSVLFFSMFSLYTGKNKFETTYSEVKTIQLSDGSYVTLGPNSKISYSLNWNSEQERELWLKGEALFSVKHLNNHRKFIVYTNDIEVEVLGTDFNVNDRGEEVKVVLENGQVNLRIPDQDETTEILMQPGEIVKYSPSTKKTVQKSLNDTKKYTSWKDRILVFKGTPVSEIVQIFKDYHGLNVVVKDPEINDRAFTAEVPVEDADFLLTLLSESLDLKMTMINDTIVIANK